MKQIHREIKHHPLSLTSNGVSHQNERRFRRAARSNAPSARRLVVRMAYMFQRRH